MERSGGPAPFISLAEPADPGADGRGRDAVPHPATLSDLSGQQKLVRIASDHSVWVTARRVPTTTPIPLCTPGSLSTPTGARAAGPSCDDTSSAAATHPEPVNNDQRQPHPPAARQAEAARPYIQPVVNADKRQRLRADLLGTPQSLLAQQPAIPLGPVIVTAGGTRNASPADSHAWESPNADETQSSWRRGSPATAAPMPPPLAADKRGRTALNRVRYAHDYVEEDDPSSPDRQALCVERRLAAEKADTDARAATAALRRASNSNSNHTKNNKRNGCANSASQAPRKAADTPSLSLRPAGVLSLLIHGVTTAEAAASPAAPPSPGKLGHRPSPRRASSSAPPISLELSALQLAAARGAGGEDESCFAEAFLDQAAEALQDALRRKKTWRRIANPLGAAFGYAVSEDAHCAFYDDPLGLQLKSLHPSMDDMTAAEGLLAPYLPAGTKVLTKPALEGQQGGTRSTSTSAAKLVLNADDGQPELQLGGDALWWCRVRVLQKVGGSGTMCWPIERDGCQWGRADGWTPQSCRSNTPNTKPKQGDELLPPKPVYGWAAAPTADAAVMHAAFHLLRHVSRPNDRNEAAQFWTFKSKYESELRLLGGSCDDVDGCVERDEDGAWSDDEDVGAAE